MMAVAEKYPVRFQGGPVFYPGANPTLTHTSDGPFGVAGDLMGQTELFLACGERPGFRPGAAAHRHGQADRLARFLLAEEERLERPVGPRLDG